MICLLRMKSGALCMLALLRGGPQNKNWQSTSRLIPPHTNSVLKNLMIFKKLWMFVKQQKHLLRINPRTFSMTFQSKITMIRSIRRIHHCYSCNKNIRSGWGGRVLQRESEISDLTARQWDHLQAGIQPLQSAGGTMQTPSKESSQSVSCWSLVTSLRWEGLTRAEVVSWVSRMSSSSVVISSPAGGGCLATLMYLVL